MYYLIINQKQTGPIADEKLLEAGMTPDTYVWTTGMPDWKKASEVAALQPILSAYYAAKTPNQNIPPQPNFGQQQPQQPNYGQPQQPNYGQPQQPNYGQPQQPNYGQQYNPYGQQQYNPYGQQPRKASMMTPAIIATVLGLCSLIGLVLGIFAIIKCNNANKFYSVGDDLHGDEANKSARSLTIGAYIFDVLGFIAGIVQFVALLDEL
jgi:hypothetical protein